MQIADGVRDPAERIRPVDDRSHLARLDELFQELQILRLRSRDDHAEPWLTNGDSASARIERPMAPPINRPPPSPPTSTRVPAGVRARRSCDSDRLPPMSRIRSYRCLLRVKSSRV